MRRSIRRLVLRHIAGIITASDDADGLWDNVREALGREETVDEGREVSALLARESRRYIRRAGKES